MREMEKNITASEIISLLAEKHGDDIFVPECKNGSTYLQSHRRVDAWVMKRSWAKPCYIAYEVKVQRGDFVRDCKYIDYLSMCNELYFVCPWGMINVSEVPIDVGIIFVSKKGESLVTRKKAVYRKIDDPVETLKYVLFFRSKIVKESNPNLSEYWKNWYKNKCEEIDTGRLTSKRIAKLVYEKVIVQSSLNVNLEAENYLLKNKIANIEYAIKKLDEIGITERVLKKEGRFPYGEIDRKIGMLAENVPEEIINNVEAINTASSKVLNFLRANYTKVV
jgi:hypothetical protein